MCAISMIFLRARALEGGADHLADLLGRVFHAVDLGEAALPGSISSTCPPSALSLSAIRLAILSRPSRSRLPDSIRTSSFSVSSSGCFSFATNAAMCGSGAAVDGAAQPSPAAMTTAPITAAVFDPQAGAGPRAIDRRRARSEGGRERRGGPTSWRSPLDAWPLDACFRYRGIRYRGIRCMAVRCMAIDARPSMRGHRCIAVRCRRRADTSRRVDRSDESPEYSIPRTCANPGTAMKVEGRCHCGRISYEAEVDPKKVSLCNCTDCQMLSGSAFRLSVPAPAEKFRLLTGAPKTYVKTADSGRRTIRSAPIAERRWPPRPTTIRRRPIRCGWGASRNDRRWRRRDGSGCARRCREQDVSGVPPADA